jgi:hypothetical protein
MHGTKQAAGRPSDVAIEARLPSQLVLTAAQATAGTSAADVSSTERYSALGTCAQLQAASAGRSKGCVSRSRTGIKQLVSYICQSVYSSKTTCSKSCTGQSADYLTCKEPSVQVAPPPPPLPSAAAAAGPDISKCSCATNCTRP